MSPLIHSRINLIKFVESNKFDAIYTAKFGTFLLDQIFKRSDVF